MKKKTQSCLRIGYVAKHRNGGNDDEGAIKHAFEELGHEVVCVSEDEGVKINDHDVDFVLFHKWDDASAISQVKHFKVGWYFDKVEFRQRKRVFEACARQADIMFLTDGDYAKKSELDNLEILRQGVDTRYARHIPFVGSKRPEIAFVGNIYSGRLPFFVKIRQRYGDKFTIYNGVYKRNLSYCFSVTPIVIAPPFPSTPNYWSNRVYLTTGNGGLLVHPYCSGLEDEFVDKKHLVLYKDDEELFAWIDMLLNNEERREKMRREAYLHTRFHYSYKKRCKELLSIVQKHIGTNEPKKA